jgi:hypothetical protein
MRLDFFVYVKDKLLKSLQLVKGIFMVGLPMWGKLPSNERAYGSSKFIGYIHNLHRWAKGKCF